MKKTNEQLRNEWYAMWQGPKERMPTAMQIAADYWLSIIDQERGEVREAIQEIHTELHNGRMETAYKMTCSVLSLLSTHNKEK